MHDDDAAKTLLQPNVFATNQRAQDGYRHTDTHSPGRIHTHTPRLSRLCCILLAPRSFSLSVRPQPVCVWAGGVLSVVSKCIHCARVCAVGQIWMEAITRRKLFCNQTFFATNPRAQDGYTHTDTHSPGRIHTHTPRLSRLCCLLLAPRSFSLSVGRPLFWCLLPAPSSLSLPVRPQPVCVCGGGVLSVVSKCIHRARVCS